MSLFKTIASGVTSVRNSVQNLQKTHFSGFKQDAFEEISKKLGHLFLEKKLTSENSEKLLKDIIGALPIEGHSQKQKIEALISKFDTELGPLSDNEKDSFRKMLEPESHLFSDTSKTSIPKNIQKLVALLWLYSKNNLLLSEEYDHKIFSFENFISYFQNTNITDGLENTHFDDAVAGFIIFKVQNDPDYAIQGTSIEDSFSLFIQDKFSTNDTQRYLNNLLTFSIKDIKTNTVKLILIYNKIDINRVESRGDATEGGDTPLIAAIRLRAHAVDIMKLLLQKPEINVNKKNEYGYTPLIVACRSIDIDLGVINLLLAQKQLDVNEADEDGNTPLVWTAIRGNASTMKLLIQHKQIDIEKRTPKDESALFIAVTKGNTTSARILIASGKVLAIGNTWDYLQQRQQLSMFNDARGISAEEQQFFNFFKKYIKLSVSLFLKGPLDEQRANMVDFINELRQEFSLESLKVNDIHFTFLSNTLQGRVILKILDAKMRKKDGSRYTFTDLINPDQTIKKLPPEEIQDLLQQLSPTLKPSQYEKISKEFKKILSEADKLKKRFEKNS